MKPRMLTGSAFRVRLSPPSHKPGEDDVGILTGRSSGLRIVLGAAFPVLGGTSGAMALRQRLQWRVRGGFAPHFPF